MQGRIFPPESDVLGAQVVANATPLELLLDVLYKENAGQPRAGTGEPSTS
jgi:hypothetical protein